MRARVLVVDDKENVLSLLNSVLGESYDVTTAADGQRGLALALAGEFDVVLADIRMPGSDGFAILTELKRAQPDVEVVLMTAFGSVEKAVEAIKAGAYDYLTKPFEPDQALLTVGRAVERRRLRREARSLRAALDAAHSFEHLAGKAREMQQAFELMRRAAASNVTVLITGERGTGKELAARAIHRTGARRDSPFLVVSCAAVPDQVLASELFGHPSSPADPIAREQNSAVGTVLLDEIDELDPALQARLTRALQERATRDSEQPTADRTSSRVIASSSVDLKEAVGAGRFREDLFYRLNVLRIHLPPLRERKEDIPILALRFLDVYGKRYGHGAEGFEPDALSALMRYEWPGNVRELENAVERALAVVDAPRIPLEALPDEVRGVGTGGLSGLAQLTYHDAVELARDRASREYLITLMQQFGGSVTRAAERAGMERESLHRLLKRYGLRSNEFKDP